MAQPLGLNVQKLIAHRMAMLMIPPGTAQSVYRCRVAGGENGETTR